MARAFEKAYYAHGWRVSWAQDGSGQRWVCINKAPVGEPDGGGLAVQYPADLAWDGITCHVLDQRTLKMKQVRLDATMRMWSSKPRMPPWPCVGPVAVALPHTGPCSTLVCTAFRSKSVSARSAVSKHCSATR